MRLCMLEATLPRFAHPTNGWQARPRNGNLSRLDRIRERYMCFGCQAPMGELLSLRSYGRAFSRSDGPSFRVNWSEDSETVSWTGGKLSMDQFRDLGARVYDSAAASMSRLMYGLESQLHLDDIQDRLSAHEYGYSFVQDPANGLRSEYLKLSSRACLNPIDGLMSGERWNFDAVRRYLTEESNLVLLLFQLLFLRAGQGPRTLELSSIECYNGPTTSRGLYVHNGLMVYITRHAKARQATNQEFQVARYLSHEDSALLGRFLVYVRPFADMLYRKCNGREQDRRLLFAAPDNFDRPWRADVLTRALKGLTTSVCGAAFGVQVYRQLSIAITERHIKSICRPFNRYDDKSADADIEVVFAWQSGHRPVQRGTSYGIDAAYPDSLQPALLRVYHWASCEWHRFLRIDSAVRLRIPVDGQGSRGPQQLESGTNKRPLHGADGGRPPKRLQNHSHGRSISPPSMWQTYVPEGRHALQHQIPASASSLSVLGNVPQGMNGVGVSSGGAGRNGISHIRRGESPIGPASWRSDSTARPSHDRDNSSEVAGGSASSESSDDAQCYDEGEQAETYGIRGSFLDLGDLVRCHALRNEPDSRVPEYVSCEDVLHALRQLPRTTISRISEIEVPDQLTAADDYGNTEYIKELGQYLGQQAAHISVVTLPVPDDLIVGDSENEGQYEYRLWALHAAVIDAFVHEGFMEVRFVHPRKYAEETIDVYQMHNVCQYITPMLIGVQKSDALREKTFHLIQSQRYPVPPSTIDDTDSLFAILHALEFDAFTEEQYSIAFTQPHEWEVGSVLALHRSPQTVHTFSNECRLAASWWLARCAFCVGNGLWGSNVTHAITTCQRGGCDERRWNLGRQIFGQDIKAKRGCKDCACPKQLCISRTQTDRRFSSHSRECPFGEIVYDVVVGLLQSECYFYREMLEFEMGFRGEDSPGEKAMALWLMAPMPGAEQSVSRLIRIFLLWTRAVREQLNKRETRAA